MRAFERLIALQSKLGLPVVHHYAPGLSDAEIDVRLMRYSFEACDGFKSLYNAANGSTKNDQCPMYDLWVIPGYYMLELDEALGTAAYLARSDPDWLPGWLPLFSSGGASLIVCNAKGHVLRSSPEEMNGTRVLAETIELFVLTVVQNLERGNLHKHSDGLWGWVTPPW